jgi:LPXTG-motif cell wall-anchored protein
MNKRRSVSDAFRDDDEDGTDNPLISLQEQADEEPTVRVSGAETLMAVFQEGGMPLVAKAALQDGEVIPCEPLRNPTPEEFGLVKDKGRIVKGGVINKSPYCYNPRQRLGEAIGGTKSVTVFGTEVTIWPPFGMFTAYSKPVQAALWLGIVAAAGGGFWWYRKRKNERG